MASDQITSLRDLTYEERLERLGLSTLEEEREKGDLMAHKVLKEIKTMDSEELFIWNGKENTEVTGRS